MKENTNISERLAHVIEYLCLNRNEFAQKLGYVRSQSIYDIINEKAKPSYDFFNRFVSSGFSESINLEWLITGKGEMLKSKPQEGLDVQIIHKPKYQEIYSSNDIPLYDIDAVAGFGMLFTNGNENIIDYLRIPNLPKCDGAIYARGDSMYPLLKSGDIIIFKEINNIEYLFFGEMYILAFNLNGDEHLTVKFINKSDREGHVKLVSQNSYHAPVDIPISSIQTLALVKASVRINTMK